MNGNNIEMININNWQAFVDDNDEIMRELNNSCSSIDEIVVYLTSIELMYPVINSKLSGLENVSIGVDVAEGLADLQSQVDNLLTAMQVKIVRIVTAIYYAQNLIKSFDTGEPISDDINELYNMIAQDVVDSNIFWLVNEFLKETPYSAIGGLVAYGTDATFEGGNFVVGDGAVSLFRATIGEHILLGTKEYFANASVGASMVVLFTAMNEYYGDQGDFTSLDADRMAAQCLINGVSYAQWTLIAGLIGGVPGVLAASLIGIPTSYIYSNIKDIFVGDNIIDQFSVTDENGILQYYEVPANGNGENGTYDALLELYLDDDYYINGERVSKNSYYEILYDDWENFLRLQGQDNLFDQDTINTYNNTLNMISNAADWQEVEDYLDSSYNRMTYNTLTDVMSNYGLTFEDYYNYTHGGDINA